MNLESPPRTLHGVALKWLREQLCDLPIVHAKSVCEVPGDLRLAELPGRPDMRLLYAALRAHGVEMPPLFLSRLQHVLVALVGLCVFLSAAANMQFDAPVHSTRVITAVLSGLLTWAVLALFAKLFLAHISSAESVDELACQILAANPMFFSRLSGLPLTRSQVQETVINILVDVCGVDREEVTLDTPLAKLMD